MMFYGIKDFYINRWVYKSYYMALNKKQIKEYKRFVYSISFENEYVKDLIWEYLNDDEMAEENLDRLYYQRMNRGKNENINRP